MQDRTILIVDDNKSVLTSLELLLEIDYKTILTSTDPNELLPLIERRRVDLVILDMHYPGKSAIQRRPVGVGVTGTRGSEGLMWLQRILRAKPGLPVVMLTAYGDVDLAVESIKRGAADFVTKPWDNHALLRKIRAALEEAKSKSPAERVKCIDRPAMIIGHSPAMMKIMKLVAKVAKTNANILISGENGTGKEMLAREIHRLSLRSQSEMMGVDMGAISESLFESELFGHEKGAFTDARERRIGKFEAANGSTLFLDEIGNLPSGLQAKLLVALQNREITRLGSNAIIPVDIRLITATNRDLREMVSHKQFREDLFYRINTIEIVIPPLRQRKEDIATFADFFLQKYAHMYARPRLTLHPQALAKLEAHHWPGNIRELQYAIEKAVILAENNIVRPSDLSLHPDDNSFALNDVTNLKEMERRAILAAISQNGDNLTAAASQLGISRQTLYNKLKRLNS